ncbi:hypothetical protein B484DRAFT_415090 [Ochromonadaceae sp. CCMP2298]|nr:hypothetical protein B484DRAFT_415090 [Ochromonadaceae sp. CCMP2298]
MFPEPDEAEGAEEAEEEERVPGSPCGRGQYCESWESMYDTLDGLFEWLVANRQNRVETLLLGSPKWGNLTSGDLRQSRLRLINRLGHSYGLLMGADIPLANRQQHGWKMVTLGDSIEKMGMDIGDRVDWAFSAEYDFISTESGLSEFTKPSCDLMLQLFDIFTERVAEHWSREALTKVHCSTSQYCTEVITLSDGSTALKYPDPRDPTGTSPINFNFLPTYARAGLGVMPHTVQVYAFDDPSANSYGNANFTYMSQYLNWESSLGKRAVLYYGESAYWVNVDVDVPLFLPLSGQRRMADLRATERAQRGGSMQGQMNFESGWEFGFWLSNCVTARAPWDPKIGIPGDWDAYAEALLQLLPDRVFGDQAGTLRRQIGSLAEAQAGVMVYSGVKGGADLTKMSGHAYMSGTDSWSDLERMLGLAMTQPDKVHIRENGDPLWAQAQALLGELSTVFAAQASQFEAIAVAVDADPAVSEGAASLVWELADCVQLLANRAAHNVLLYASQDPAYAYAGDLDAGGLYAGQGALLRGRELLGQTAKIMQRRVEGFRVPPQRISGWRQGPTVYPYGYVWAAKSLYYLWRDQGIAEGTSVAARYSPCYLNRQEPLELALGWGRALEQLLRLALQKRGRGELDLDGCKERGELDLGGGGGGLDLESTVRALVGDCLAPPLREYEFPRDL